MVTLFAVAFWTIAAGIVGKSGEWQLRRDLRHRRGGRVHLLVCSGSWEVRSN